MVRLYSNKKYIVNKYGSFKFTNSNIIDESNVFKNLIQDIGETNIFQISDEFTEETIKNYIEINELTRNKITKIFINFIDYLEANSYLFI